MSTDPLAALLREVARTPEFMGLRAGDVVGRFELLHEIGRGGFGIVFEARDTELGRLVAVKAMRPGTLAADAFKLEARAAAALNHANIVTLHDFGITNDTPYLVLERLHGETLAARCARRPLPLAELVPLALQIAHGIAHAHAAGIVHRDLKPANVFVTDEGRAKILDFGLASSHSGGTPAFMAPEQQRGDRGDGRIDLYAFGGTLHVMATGRLPGEGTVEHAGLRELIARLCAHDAAERPADARALIHALVALDPARAARDGASVLPFRYLEAFGVDDAGWFFGRDRESGRLHQMLAAQPLVAVIGPSGAGKTSLIAAGLVPRLRAHARWEIVRIRPGHDPLGVTSERIRELTGRAVELRARPGSAGQALREHARATATHVLVFVDAFEELYTTVMDREARTIFANALASCSDDPAAPLRVALAMREDFLSRLSEHPGLRDRVTRAMLIVGPPDAQALAEMVRGPAERAGFSLEAGLDDQLVTALATETAPLPLLQLAASRLWERRDEPRRLLRRDVLDELGGVPGVLATHANDVLRGLSDAERAAARRILPQLVTGERTRTRRERGEIADPEGVLDRLAAGRLVTLADDKVELAHESLIDRWDELREWLDADRDTAGLRDRLIEAASHWHERGKPPDLLWTGRTLDDAHRRFAGSPLGPQGRAFLVAAEAAVRRVRRIKRGAVVAVVVMACAIAIGAMLALQAQTRAARAAETARREETARVDQRTLATARELVERDPAAALELLTTVSSAFSDWGRLRIIAGAALAREVPRVLRGKGPLFGEIHFDGKTLYVGGDSELLHRWDVASGELRPLIGHAGRIIGLALSADKKTLISGGTDRQLRVWNTETGASRLLPGTAGTIGWVELSRDERNVLAGGTGWVRLWDLATGTSEPIRDAIGPLPNAHLLDGDRVLAFRDRSVLVGARGTTLAPIARTEEPLVSLAPTTRGTVYASTMIRRKPNVVRIDEIDLATGRARLVQAENEVSGFYRPTQSLMLVDAGGIHVPGQSRVLHHGTPIRALVSSPSGRYVASTTDEGIVWLSDLERRTTRRLVGHEAATHSLAFDPAETTLVSASVDGTVRLWTLGRSTEILDRAGDGVPLGSLMAARYSVIAEPDKTHNRLRVYDAIARESRMLEDSLLSRTESFVFDASRYWPTFVAVQGSVVRVWNLVTGELVRLDIGIAVPADPFPQAIWVHDHRRVVVRDPQHGLVVINNGAVQRPAPGSEIHAWSAELSPDGKLLAGIADNGAVQIWNLETGERIDAGRHSEALDSQVVWSADGSHIATSSIDKTIRVFRLADRTVREIKRDFPCGSVAFAPDMTRIASCCGPLGIQVYDLATGADAHYRGQRDACDRVAWSPEGTRIVSRADQGARLWDAATGESRALEIETADDHGNRVVGHADARFVLGGTRVIVRLGDTYSFADDLPLAPIALRAELARIVRERIGRAP